MRKRGEILEGAERTPATAKHYIVFYDPLDDSSFVGAIITHAQNALNAAMSVDHFKTKDESSEPFKIQYENSNLVKAKLFKLQDWGPFTRVGELTETGIKFVEATIDHLEPETWGDYLVRTHQR